jgi:hypothetical protein
MTCGVVVVELRGFEPLTPCMPLTSHSFTSQHAPMRSQASALLNTSIADGRRGAASGLARPCCWQIAVAGLGSKRLQRHRYRSASDPRRLKLGRDWTGAGIVSGDDVADPLGRAPLRVKGGGPLG